MPALRGFSMYRQRQRKELLGCVKLPLREGECSQPGEMTSNPVQERGVLENKSFNHVMAHHVFIYLGLTTFLSARAICVANNVE